MLAYKNVYKEENGVLVRNKENKIVYTDENGKKRVKTNPTYKDFADIGMFPKKHTNSPPAYDVSKEELVVSHKRGDNCWEISYSVKKREGVDCEESD